MLTGSNEALANSRQVGRKTGTRTGKKKDICTGRWAGITQTSRQTGTQRKKRRIYEQNSGSGVTL